MTQIKLYRLRAGLRQREVAERLNISQAAVSRWEVGSSNPGIDVTPFLARLYGVSVDDILSCRSQNQKAV